MKLHVLPVAAMILIIPAAANSGEPTMNPAIRAVVPIDGKMTVSDYGYRDWGPDLVEYAVDAAKWKDAVVVDASGKPVPSQIDDGVLSYIASLPRGGSSTYVLQKGPAPAASSLKQEKEGDSCILKNDILAIRMPSPEASKDFAESVSADKVSPPLLEWAGPDGSWMGGSRFATARKFASQKFSVLRQGAAVIDYEARYKLSPKGEYVMRIRLSPGLPIAKITEDFDMGETTKGEDYLLVDLGKGWQPSNITGVFYPGEQLPCKTRPGALAEMVAQKKSAKPAPAPVGGVGQEPAIPLPDPDFIKLFYIGAGAQTQGASGGVQLWDGDVKTPGAGRNIAMVSLHSGNWRRTMALPVWHKDGSGVTVGMHISVRPIRWCFEVTDDFSPFSTHEHDDGLPRTYGRREWGLYVGSDFENAQPIYGHIALDSYKNWILDWPEGAAAKNAYPGGFFKKDHVERLKKNIDQNPAADALRNRYLISGKTEDAIKNAQSVIARLKNPEPPYVERDFWLWGQANYRKSQLLIYVNEAEDALACPDLPADLRKELLRHLTLYAYVCSSPDWNPRGAGVHHGNNNMPINRTLALAYFAGLLPSHPCYGYWMDCVRNFTEFKLNSQFSPGGEALECPTYSTYAPAGALNIAQNILRHRDIADLTSNGVTRRNLEYMANLTMQDPRFGGARIIPGMGNSGNDQDSVWGVSVATFLDQDPAFAGWCKAMFKAAGAKFAPISTGTTFVGHPMYYLPDVPDSPLEFKTVFMPAYGVAFRAHGGTPDETAMLFRAGVNTGHWDPDPLNVILYGKGAPLSPGTGYQYYGGVGTHDGAVYHNRVRVGEHNRPELFGRVDVSVADYGFGPNADYAVANRYLPPEMFSDGKGEMSWRRHVLFLKSGKPEGPSYFVMRDTFPGGEDRNKWWTWLNLELPDKISVDGKAFDKDKVPVEKAVEEKDMPVLRGQTVEMGTDFGAGTFFRFGEPYEVRIRGIMRYHASHNAQETKTIVEALAGAGQDYFYVVYPKKNGEPAPACEKIADGAFKVATPEGTDYAFISDQPITFDKDGVLFSGKAGAVRIFADRVALCMNSGSGRIGCKGMIFEGSGPFEKVIPLNDLKEGVNKIDGYEKKIVSVDIGQSITVKGEAPFEAKLDAQAIQIKAKGRAQVFHVTQPPFIIRPQYWVDGKEAMASWTDYPASGWGSYKNTWLIALPVPDGEHELILKDFRFPKVWARQFSPAIGGLLPSTQKNKPGVEQ